MGGQRFQEGESVYVPIRIGRDFERRRLGEVVQVGARGVLVRYAEGDEMWLQNSRVKKAGTEQEETVPKTPAPRPAAENDTRERRPPEPVLVVAPPPRPPPSPEVAAASTAIDRLGSDALEVWLRMGEQLHGGARARVAARRAEVEQARALLDDATRELAEAEAALDRIEAAMRPGGG